VGIYGTGRRGGEVLTEDSDRGDGFLADVVAAWEDATARAASAGIRAVAVRTGVVQSPRGGMLRLLYPLFAAGLGGPLGNGQQWLPWIGIDDPLDIYLRAITDPELAGPVIAVAPDEVRNAEYTRKLARVLGRPAVLPVPAAGPRLLLGAEGARELAEASQRVRPGARSSTTPAPRRGGETARRRCLPTLTRMTTITVAPANEASWDDLRAVFGSRGDPARCQCQYLKTRDWRSLPVAERAERLRTQTSCGDPGAATTSGLVAYVGRTGVMRIRGTRHRPISTTGAGAVRDYAADPPVARRMRSESRSMESPSSAALPNSWE
jgi:hypothetical protein